MFIDYMLSPKVFTQFLESKTKNYVNEINLQLSLKKLNLFADISKKNKNIIFKVGHFMKKFDYENVLNM